MSEPVYGNHIGIIVNSNDPESRGRVQVFVPYLSTTLFTGWNEKGSNISIRQGDLSSIEGAVLERLKKLLPWAESANQNFGVGGGTSYSDPATGSTRIASTGAPTVTNVANKDLRNGQPTSVVNPSAGNPNPENNTADTNGKVKGNSGYLQPTVSDGTYNKQPTKVVQTQDMVDLNLQIIKECGSGLTNNLPRDAERFGLDNTPESWAKFMGKVPYYETGNQLYGPEAQNLNDPGGSYGPYSLSPYTARDFGKAYPTIFARYGVEARVYSPEELRDPVTSARINLAYCEAMMAKPGNNVIQAGTGNSRLGMSRGYAANTLNALAGQRDPSSMSTATKGSSSNSGPATTAGGNTALSHDKSHAIDTTSPAAPHDMRTPHGVNSTPSPGNMVYVFFLGGDPQRPVYFAAVAEPGAAGRTDQGNVQVPVGTPGPVASQNAPNQGSTSPTSPSSGATITQNNGQTTDTSVSNTSPGEVPAIGSSAAVTDELSKSSNLVSALIPMSPDKVMANLKSWDGAKNQTARAVDVDGNLVYAALTPGSKGDYAPDIITSKELSNLIVTTKQQAATDPSKQVLVDYYTSIASNPLTNEEAFLASQKVLSKNVGL